MSGEIKGRLKGNATWRLYKAGEFLDPEKKNLDARDLICTKDSIVVTLTSDEYRHLIDEPQRVLVHDTVKFLETFSIFHGWPEQQIV